MGATAAAGAVQPGQRPRSGAGERLKGLDVFRGLSVAGMILVTDPGTYTAVYPQLLHATWRGATATDMIFPAFLLAAGVSIPLALGSRLTRGQTRAALAGVVLRRAGLLVLLGLLLNAYPAFAWRTLRLPGVLQRIGLCYLVAALFYLAVARRPTRTRALVFSGAAALLLAGYGAILLWVPVPGYGAGHLDTLRSLPAYLDRLLFTVPHLWTYGVTPGVGVTFDPEGALSTLPAIAAVLLGVVAGEVLGCDPEDRKARLRWIALAGVGLFAAGLALDPALPIIKKLWTPSFGLLSSGVGLVGLAGCVWIVDGLGLRRGLTPLLIFGTNAIAAFTLSGLLTTTLNVLQVHGSNWHAWGYAHLFLPWLPPVQASLAYAMAIVAVNCAVIGELYRRRIFLRL